MSRFFVGQRVRLVGKWDGKAPPHTSMEGVVVGIGNFDREWSGRSYTYEVETLEGWQVFANADELEPILPEGAAPSEFTTLHELLDSLTVPA